MEIQPSVEFKLNKNRRVIKDISNDKKLKFRYDCRMGCIYIMKNNDNFNKLEKIKYSLMPNSYLICTITIFTDIILINNVKNKKIALEIGQKIEKELNVTVKIILDEEP